MLIEDFGDKTKLAAREGAGSTKEEDKSLLNMMLRAISQMSFTLTRAVKERGRSEKKEEGAKDDIMKGVESRMDGSKNQILKVTEL